MWVFISNVGFKVSKPYKCFVDKVQECVSFSQTVGDAFLETYAVFGCNELNMELN